MTSVMTIRQMFERLAVVMENRTPEERADVKRAWLDAAANYLEDRARRDEDFDRRFLRSVGIAQPS